MVDEPKSEQEVKKDLVNSIHTKKQVVRDCFWDGSVPNPLEVSVGSPTMSVSSNIPEPSGAGKNNNKY
jgi:hypothetical protein